jgi:hypothetical protein
MVEHWQTGESSQRVTWSESVGSYFTHTFFVIWMLVTMSLILSWVEPTMMVARFDKTLFYTLNMNYINIKRNISQQPKFFSRLLV